MDTNEIPNANFQPPENNQSSNPKLDLRHLAALLKRERI
jgi:hypothetical protein